MNGKKKLQQRGVNHDSNYQQHAYKYKKLCRDVAKKDDVFTLDRIHDISEMNGEDHDKQTLSQSLNINISLYCYFYLSLGLNHSNELMDETSLRSRKFYKKKKNTLWSQKL